MLESRDGFIFRMQTVFLTASILHATFISNIKSEYFEKDEFTDNRGTFIHRWFDLLAEVKCTLPYRVS